MNCVSCKWVYKKILKSSCFCTWAIYFVGTLSIFLVTIIPLVKLDEKEYSVFERWGYYCMQWIKEFAFLLVVLMSKKNSDLDLKEAIFLTLLGLSPFRMVSLVVKACFTWHAFSTWSKPVEQLFVRDDNSIQFNFIIHTL